MPSRSRRRDQGTNTRTGAAFPSRSFRWTVASAAFGLRGPKEEGAIRHPLKPARSTDRPATKVRAGVAYVAVRASA